MDCDSEQNARTGPPSAPPSNQRRTFLDALSLTLREHNPGTHCEVSRFKAQLPPLLRVSWRGASLDVGCDLGRNGWMFVRGFDPRAVLGPVGSLTGVARTVAEILGIPQSPPR
ncbi:hypothetical protein [Actinomadura atramentaria]|uniref:hypothetical protein n=1 Tax=Actinomadura atramentaria TaxID=1990 RepID=UPI0003A11BBD|nr:hypothetical protein [Actinomadura atramentaria]